MREGMSFSKINFRIKSANGDGVQSRFIQPAFHQLHVQGEASFPSILLRPVFIPLSLSFFFEPLQSTRMTAALLPFHA